MRYFVTGGTGFIGGRLVRRLLALDHEVVALVRDPSRAGDLAQDGAELARGDITDRRTLAEPMAGADGVYHLAAWYQVGTGGERAEAINVEGTRNVLEVMAEVGVAKGVYTSSLAVNSDTGGRRVDETYRYQGDHLSVYDETKWRAHYEVALPMAEAGLPLVIVMPGVVYGPGDTSQMGELLRDALEGRWQTVPGGDTGACWAYVDDVVDGHILAMQRGRPGESYILAGPCHTYQEAFQTAARVTGTKLRVLWAPPALMRAMAPVAAAFETVVPLPPEFTAEALRVTGGTTYYGDNGKARRELGYAPRPLAEGMRQTFGGPGVEEER